MMEVVPFKAHHLTEIDLQCGQQYLSAFITPSQGHALEAQEWSFTGVVNGIPLASAGVIPMWMGRGMCWAYLSDHARGSKFLAVHRAVKRFLEGVYVQRLEMTVDTDFEPGHRWAEMLGFEMECAKMRAYRPDGGDCALYARVL